MRANNISRVVTFGVPRNAKWTLTIPSHQSGGLTFQKATFRNTRPKSDEANSLQQAQVRVVDVTAPVWFQYYKNKFDVTAEITVSKLFPAGFGWQGFSVVAVNNGFSATSMGFFGLTAVGDALGVGTGHLLFNAVKAALGWKVNFVTEVQTATFLSTATIFSGFAWQPSLNYFQSLGLPFFGCFFGTGLVCATGFLLGLRLGRTIYPSLMPAIEGRTRANLINDVGLSLGIGGAAAFFVGTDVTFGAANPFLSLLGVFPEMSPLQGMIRAGSSTALGFFVSHTLGYLGLAALRRRS